MFGRFTDTIFLKETSELEKQVKALEELNKEYPYNRKINKELENCKKGIKGEKEIEYELKNANIGMYVLHDINLKFEDLTAQIDYIVVTPAVHYFVECKNYSGNIVIDKNGNFTREYGRSRVGIESPYRQAQRHLEVVRKIVDKNQSNFAKIIRIFWDEFYSVHKPIVVLTNKESILKDSYAPKEIKDRVIKSERLVDYISKDMQYWRKNDRESLSNRNEMESQAIFYLVHSKAIDINYKQEYFNKYILENIKKEQTNNQQGINSKDKETLKKRLINYRLTKSKAEKIPAYYIFNNEELEQILDIMPTTFEELEKSKILPYVKIKLYGQEIVDIIKEYK